VFYIRDSSSIFPYLDQLLHAACAQHIALMIIRSCGTFADVNCISAFKIFSPAR